MTPDALEKLTQDFFAAINRRDWADALERVHPDGRARQNISGEDVDARTLLNSMRGLVESLKSFGYENPRRILGEQAVVEQHDVRMTREDGREIVLDICILLHFDGDGKITRIDEYLDSAQVAAFLS